MAGTDKSQQFDFRPSPAVILCEPQLGENIGTTARAMANFGLWDLRLVNPRDGWPNEKAIAAASRAEHVLDRVRVFATARRGDCRSVAGLCDDRPAPRFAEARVRTRGGARSASIAHIAAGAGAGHPVRTREMGPQQ